MNETLLVIATMLAGAVGSPIVEGIKNLAAAGGKTIEGNAAFYLTVGVSVALGAVVLVIGGVFSPPYPDTWQGWVTLAGGAASAIFAMSSVIFRQLFKKPAE